MRLFLLALATGATLAIWSADPFTEWAYESGVLLLAGWIVFRTDQTRGLRWGPVLAPASLLALWGFGQLVAGATVYRYATLNASLRATALAATALAASAAFRQTEARDRLLPWLARFGFLLSVASVVAYYTSPGKILWMFSSPYPDVWGPFLSRNNFAQFLELALPVALWLGCRRGRTVYLWMGAAMLASGLASA